MFIYIAKVIASLLLPPGIILLALGGLTLYLGRKRCLSAQWLLIGITGVFYVLSTSYAGNWLVGSLECRYTPPAIVSGDVIVMLGGGATADTPDINGQGHLSGHAANRLLTAARLQRQLGIPVLISGGQVFTDSGREAVIGKRMLLELGVADDQVITEDASLNTEQNAQYVKQVLIERGFTRPILVTSAFHMERSVLNFHKQLVEVQPFPAGYIANGQTAANFTNFLPSAGAFDNSCLALHEYLGILATRVF